MKCVRNVGPMNIIINQQLRFARDFGIRDQHKKKARDFGLNAIISDQESRSAQES
jgi:hypothetical protein